MSPRHKLGEALRAEDGGIVILFALLTPFLVLLLALVVDIGNWWVHKRHLQLQADAAALAGGARFGSCFPDAAVGNTVIPEEATKYSGGPGSLHNEQVGNLNRGTIIVRYQSKTFAVGGPEPDDTETEPPCNTASLMFDVKATEENLPLLFDFPGLDFVPSINAQARVQLRKAVVADGSMPLAVPEVNPKFVTATFVNEATGAIVAGPVSLTRGAPSGSLQMWSGPASVTAAAGQEVGVRIGVGQVVPTCSGAAGTGGPGFVCYDYDASSRGLVEIAAAPAGGTPLRPAPRVWPITACAGSPFFSDESLGEAGVCAAGVEVAMESVAGAIDPALVRSFTATIDRVTRPLTFAGGVWSTGYAFDIPVDGGPYEISLEWTYTGGTRQSYTNVQRIYSGNPDSSGPVKVVSLSEPGGAVGAPYGVSAGSHDINVTVGLTGNLSLTPVGETVVLRLTGGSRTSAVACDGPGAALFRDAIVNGCSTPYQINVPGICPHPAPPAGPAACIPTQTGGMEGPTLQGLDARFASCPPYNWPAWEPGDPRIITMLITDFSALGGSGTTDVPVLDFAAFYIGGWSGSRCSTNTPRPASLPSRFSAIWGHFFKYVGPDPNTSATTETCDPTSMTPCLAVMTK